MIDDGYDIQALQSIAVDFDGTLATSIWPDRGIGQPMEGNILKLIDLASEYDIVIYTARPWSDEKRLKKWLDAHEIPYKQIICGKYLALAYLDDRNIHLDGNWREQLQ